MVHLLVVLIYVNDIVVGNNDQQAITTFKSYLNAKFKSKDMRHLKYFLGLEVARSKKGIFLNQRHYTYQLLSEIDLLACKPSTCPMDANSKLCKDVGSLLQYVTQYRRLIRKLQYLTITRPDIAFTVNSLSQYMEQPHDVHLQAANKVLQYLKGTFGKGILFLAENSLDLIGYADADWETCIDTRRSVTGLCVFIGCGRE